MIRSIFAYLCMTLTSLTNIHAITFTNHGVSNLRQLYNSHHVEADFNNDGYMDVLISGNDGTADYTEIYLNNKDLTFSLLPSSIPQLSQVVADVADFNGDGYVDIVISGLNAGQKYCKIFKNNGDNTFSVLDAPIEDVAYGTVLWADFNNDGILDLFTCGINQAGKYVSRMYKGGNNTFTLVNTIIPSISSGSAVILDINNDRMVDIALTGYNSIGQIVSYLYKNKGNFNFENVNTGFERVVNGGMVAADINADGFTDIIITGTNHLNKKVSELYLNNNGTFIRSATAGLDSLSSSSVGIADFDGDGYPDILMTGTDNRGFYNTILYLNNRDNTFTRNATLFPAFTMASAAIADFDKDHRMDIILFGKTYTGNYTYLYTNNALTANTAPSIPTSLNAFSANDSVILTWDKAADNETPANGLSYNLYVGRSSGNYDMTAPCSELANGLRKIIKTGNTFQVNALTLKNLSEGKYYWSVQSIDNTFEGSAFASEKSFTICHNLSVGQDTTVCRGDSVTLHAGTASDIVNWYSVSKGVLGTNTRTLKYKVDANDKVIVELTNPLGCTLHDTISLKIRALPIVKLGNDTSICYLEPITLNAGGGWSKVSWFMNNDLIASNVPAYKYNVNTNATFTVDVIDNNGCKNSDTINITKADLPSFTLGTDKWLCFKDTAKLTASKSFPEIKWYQMRNSNVLASGLNYKFPLSKTDTIVARAIDTNGCRNTDTIVVNMRSLPDIKLPKDTSICFGEEVTINANKKFFHISWLSANIGNPVNDTSSIRFKVENNDAVKAIATDNFGCVNVDTILITKYNLPVFSIGADTGNCIGTQVLFNAKPGWKRVDWYKTGNTLLLANNWFYKHTISENTKIWARVMDSNNCINYDTVKLTSYPLPVFNLGNDTSICKNEIIHLTSQSDYKNTTWKSTMDGIILSGPNSIDLKVLQKDIISAEVTDLHSCSNTDTIKINMFALPRLDFNHDTTACYNSNLHLDAGNYWKTISWARLPGGSVLSTNYIYDHVYTSADTLAIHVVDENGCHGADTMMIKVAQLPKFYLGNDTSICRGSTISLNISKDYDVKWYSLRDGLIASGNTLTKYGPLTTDTIIAVAKGALTCQGSDTIQVKVNALPIADAGLDTLVCYGASIVLGGKNVATGNGPFLYLWKTGDYVNSEEKPVIIAKEDKTYLLKLTDSNGCENTDSVHLQVNSPGKINLAKQFTICKGQKVSLGQNPLIIGSKFPYNFQWFPDSALSAYNIETPIGQPLATTTYRLIVSTWRCPADTAYTTIIVRGLPKPYVSPTLSIGNEGSVQLYAEGGVKYRWRPADNLNRSDIPDPLASPHASTLYTVEVIDTFGCSSEASVQVNVHNEVFIPEIFTPNGDRKNDLFKIYGFGIVELSITIFDRNNNKVFESIDKEEIMNQGWDGICKGQPLEAGIYRWVIRGHFADGQPVLVKGKNTGIITLIR